MIEHGRRGGEERLNRRRRSYVDAHLRRSLRQTATGARQQRSKKNIIIIWKYKIILIK
jgi:hypothetical protein